MFNTDQLEVLDLFASFASLLPNRTAAFITVGVSILSLATICIIYRIWPLRLTDVLYALMTETVDIYFAAVEAGELPGDTGTEETLNKLQLEVSKIREASLDNSMSTWKTLGDFFRGRSFAVLRCTSDVRKLKTQIEMLKETQLQTNLNLRAAWATSLRRRRAPKSHP
ncbi:hypothetical protein C8J57DRAFT_1413248 [Mycena rebaudengoi]|nr:hypothetical protein C8J57DRAFT_1413248 [Mycena rebaudengoi]